MTTHKWMASLALFVLLQPVLASAGIDAKVPVVLIVNNYGFDSGGSLVDMWIEHATNKRADVQIEAFRNRTSTVQWAELASKELACFAVEKETPCRRVLLVEPEAKIDDLIRNEGTPKIIVMELVQMFRPSSRYRARLVVREVDLDKGKVKEIRSFTSLYETYVPLELQDGQNNSKPQAEEYWTGGQPSRLESEARHSLAELRNLADELEKAVVSRNKVPAEWKTLPNIKALKQSGRVRCGGIAVCGDVWVYEERDGRIWFANSVPLGRNNGPTLASLDANASAHETNLFFMVLVPD